MGRNLAQASPPLPGGDSGAFVFLHFLLPGSMNSVRITATENGSLKVEGPFELLDHQGQPLPTREGKPTYLCRCGKSANAPFCDGSHNRQGE
jgi:CDGSH iron-sulfur domain-containing protein 3